MWPWIKVKVNIVNTWCIIMSEEVTVPSSTMMMTSTVSEESLARHTLTDRQTDRHTHRDSGRLRQHLRSRLRLCKQKAIAAPLVHVGNNVHLSRLLDGCCLIWRVFLVGFFAGWGGCYVFVCAFTLDNLFGLKLKTLQSSEFYHTRLLKRLPFDIYFLDTTQA